MKVIDKIRAAAQKGAAQHKDSIEKARIAAEKKAEQQKRDEEERLKADRKICREWIDDVLPELVEKWAAAGRKKIKFSDLGVAVGEHRVYSDTLIASCLQEAGLEVEVDKRWVPESRDIDYSWDAHWDITYYLVLP